MTHLVTFLPGVLGVIAAFLVDRLLVWLGFTGFPLDLLVMIVVYVAVRIAADRAFKAYGRTPS